MTNLRNGLWKFTQQNVLPVPRLAEGAIVDQAAKWTNFAFWDVAR